jgi:hypothetical protein
MKRAISENLVSDRPVAYFVVRCKGLSLNYCAVNVVRTPPPHHPHHHHQPFYLPKETACFLSKDGQWVKSSEKDYYYYYYYIIIIITTTNCN